MKDKMKDNVWNCDSYMYLYVASSNNIKIIWMNKIFIFYNKMILTWNLKTNLIF
jgi:hypothetical protein